MSQLKKLQRFLSGKEPFLKLLFTLVPFIIVVFLVFLIRHNSASDQRQAKIIIDEQGISGEIFQLIHSDPSHAREVAIKILDSLQIENTSLEVDILKHIGSSYALEANYSEALNYYSAALIKAKEKDFQVQIADINNNIGLVSRSVGNFKNAILHFTEAINYYENSGNKDAKAGTLNNLGLLHLDLENHEVAEIYFQRAFDGFSQIKDTIGMSIVLNNLSLSAVFHQQYIQAREYLYESIHLAMSANNKYGLCLSYYSLGQTFRFENKHKEAIEAYEKSMVFAMEINQPHQYALGQLGISQTLLLSGNYYEALKISKQVMDVAIELDNISLITETHKILSKIFKLTGSYKNSLYHYTEYTNTKESLLSQTNVNHLHDFEMSMLSRANKLQQLELERKEMAINKKNYILSFTILTFILILIGFYLIYLNHRNRQRVKLQQTIIHLTEKKSHAAVEAEILERKRIGQELHDGLGQMLSVAGLHVSVLQKKKNISEIRRNELLDAAMRSIDEAFNEVRNISHNLSPCLLSERGLEGALKNLADHVNHSEQLNMSFMTFGLNGKLNPLVENTLYRSVQEILNNTIKHSNASKLSFHIAQGNNEITLMAEDNGIGFDISEINDKSGSGLFHMKSRIENLNGNLNIDSNPSRGTIISIVIPLNQVRNEYGTYKSINS
jgi:two-component system, NarL family, sensor kinase